MREICEANFPHQTKVVPRFPQSYEAFREVGLKRKLVLAHGTFAAREDEFFR